QIDAFIRGLAGVPTAPASSVVNSSEPAVITGDYSCVSQNLTQVAPLSNVSILADGTSNLFPGALLRGDSLYTGQFAEAAFARNPLTYSLSVQDGTGAARSATMQDPSLSAFRDTIGAILSQANLGQVPISAQINAQEVHSEQDLAIAL